MLFTKMTEIPNPLILEETLRQYPPQVETNSYEVKGAIDIITAEVSRDPEGRILYVVPGSVKYVQRNSKPEQP